MDENQAITEAATQAKVAYLNGNDTLGDYWTERAQRLSDQAEAVRRRFLMSAENANG